MTEVVLPKDDDNTESTTPEEKLENEGIKPAPPQRKLEMVDYGAIGVFKNAVPKEICESTINTFENWYKKRYAPGDFIKQTTLSTVEGSGQEITMSQATGMDGTQQFIGAGPGKSGNLGRKDVQLFLEAYDDVCAKVLATWLGDCFRIYTDKYRGAVEGDPLSSTTYKIQKTPPGGGYHVWHCEDSGFLYRDRVITWMIYLNDIPRENGGATDFLHQELSLQPEQGTIVFWPAAYTHTHRGAFLTGDTYKYIATGWFNREAPRGL